mmetsp:Transcript_1359/g.4271  ORF Transcript_1359/g.4271 Transcript_1359/m.4271 type:complete len:283 (-) Transcript_1359:1798-2646(-)
MRRSWSQPAPGRPKRFASSSQPARRPPSATGSVRPRSTLPPSLATPRWCRRCWTQAPTLTWSIRRVVQCHPSSTRPAGVVSPWFGCSSNVVRCPRLRRPRRVAPPSRLQLPATHPTSSATSCRPSVALTYTVVTTVASPHYTQRQRWAQSKLALHCSTLVPNSTRATTTARRPSPPSSRRHPPHRPPSALPLSTCCWPRWQATRTRGVPCSRHWTSRDIRRSSTRYGRTRCPSLSCLSTRVPQSRDSQTPTSLRPTTPTRPTVLRQGLSTLPYILPRLARPT